MAGWFRKGSVPKTEEGREPRKERRQKREERREKREETREQRKERREKREERRPKDAMVRFQNGGMVQKRVGP